MLRGTSIPNRNPRWGEYDVDLQMFKREPAIPDQNHLEFQRYLVETGRMDGPPVGPSCGAFAEQLPEHSYVDRDHCGACQGALAKTYLYPKALLATPETPLPSPIGALPPDPALFSPYA